MELLACLIGSRHISKLTHIVPKFQNANCYCWTDASIALAWITSQPKNNNNRDLFVKNRVNEIQTLTSQMCWRHVSTYDNPADLATRANMTMKSLLDAQIWWNGPPWIILYSSDWPVNTLNSHITENIELINTCAHVTNAHEHVIDEPLFDLKMKSRLQIVLRVTAYILRWISKSSLPYGHRTLVTSSGKRVQTPSNEEMSRAKTYWIKWVQQTSFHEELTVLHKQMNVTTKSKLWSLGPTLDANGILVSVGRTHRVLTRNLVILPSASELTRLIILDQHERLFHAGVTLTLSETRMSYWIIRGRQTVKRVIRDCLICKRHKVLPYLQVQSALPEWRIAERPAFSASGIDFCGPFYTKEGKAYILLFTCCSTRAIHLELTRDQSTESVINAYRRFISRRGHCEFIISDNAKSFLRARQDLNSIKWVTIPERSPWWGGFWERLVRSIKTALRRSLGRACLTFEELRTVITEIEAAINLRPITYVSDDRDDPQPLRPIDFILAPESPTLDTLAPNQQLLGRWKHRQATFRNVWKRWKKEYLSELHRWTISNFGQGLPNVGDVVLVDPLKGSNRALFPLGMVTQLIEGRDGRVRAAYVRVNGKILRRTTRHLFPLETSEFPQTDS